MVPVHECYRHPLVARGRHHLRNLVFPLTSVITVSGPVSSVRLEPLVPGPVLAPHHVTERLPMYRQFPVPVVLTTKLPTVVSVFLHVPKYVPT
ncbi:Hypothetical predicted protein [Marmota monax]|uniref:Uncharacterized protein n=1 Tax=Marmota monax TaxID=9995 RepID=A0A5E4CWT5_MARMO|nr:Hypothetical predicted protein [Marmota monax]